MLLLSAPSNLGREEFAYDLDLPFREPPRVSAMACRLASGGAGAIEAGATEAPSKLPDPMIWTPAEREVIKSAKEAINVFDFEPVARKNVPPAHFGYMASGIDDEVTLRANREGFLKFQLKPRRLNDVSKVDMSVELFGTRYASPIFVCRWGPISSFIRMASSPSPKRPAPAIICRFSPPRRTMQSSK
jgi:hypothetical protein